ncbi:hypothetical protein [Neobacillus sp. FSL H8-0543]|uniref:hypothetical protein n=1 Tax=Neobacillus sp. FSL H8-0543 TaxID=2954672 RepID=UPI0031592B89
MNSTQNGSIAVDSIYVQEKKEGSLYIAFGWVFSLLSLLFFPIILGAIAFFSGYQVFHKRSPLHGIAIMFFAIIGFTLGSLYSFLVAGTNFI